jgi:pimeloyl-ACP methyl ester carboxylesterase
VPVHAWFRLLRWLGPWSKDHAPASVVREEVVVPVDESSTTPMKAWLYRPTDRPVIGAYLVLQGLHFDGPADIRLDRFARILANAGFVVHVPFLPTFNSLVVDSGVFDEARRALLDLLSRDRVPLGVRPGVFSVSFGSLPAFHLASDSRTRDRIGALAVFGGYADFDATMRFACGDLRGVSPPPPQDPLNLPVLFLNVLDAVEEKPNDTSHVVDAWHAFVRETWGKMEMKQNQRFVEVANKYAAGLSSDAERRLYLRGTRVEPGGPEMCLRALARRQYKPYLDPRPLFASIRCPVYVVHGMEDDVIPFTQLAAIVDAMPKDLPVHSYLTGLFHHTGSLSLGAMVRMAPLIAKELWYMGGILRALVRAGTSP